jgi:Fic/DOC family N-terminal
VARQARCRSRRGRLTCDYDAYCPDLLTGRHFTLEGDVAANVADAETAITRLNAQASALADTEGLARLLLRAEAVASSRIENLRSAPGVCSAQRRPGD